ncbi:MAG: hypothetical protein WCL37_02240 [Chrysiogenales bacterium]
MSVKDQKTILLVEDEVLTAMAEKNTLENFGYKVIIAHSDGEAVAVVAKMLAIDLAAGCTEPLTKPIKKEILLETIQKYRPGNHDDIYKGDTK